MSPVPCVNHPSNLPYPLLNDATQRPPFRFNVIRVDKHNHSTILREPLQQAGRIGNLDSRGRGFHLRAGMEYQPDALCTILAAKVESREPVGCAEAWSVPLDALTNLRIRIEDDP